VISFVTWLWHKPGYRSTFTSEQVNTLFDMVDRHYSKPHRKICVTNLSKGIDGSIEIVRDTEDFANVGNPSGGHNPSCYRRLRMFRRDAGATFGDRIVSMDLDTVIVGALDPLFDRKEDFVIWSQSDRRSRGWVNGSLMMLTAGARPEVWERFDPRKSPIQARSAGSAGSDQGWIGYILGKKQATWTEKDGVYSYRVHIAPKGNELPANARIVNFHGHADPWDYNCQQVPWIRTHYRRQRMEAAS
jgi:hypothetical protein